MTRVSHKTGVGEKGQRANRSTDVYLSKEGVKEAALCKKCGALYRKKRWSVDEEELKKAKAESGLNEVTCPPASGWPIITRRDRNLLRRVSPGTHE